MNVVDFAASTADLADTRSPFSARRPAASFAPSRRPRNEVSIPNGLVVSGEDTMRLHLGEALLLCGVAPSFSSSLEQAAPLVATGDFSFVLCQDTLPDGKYADLLAFQRAARSNVPLIVVSPTGDWPEYFAAVDLGAQDYLAYPLVPGELPRIVRTALEHGPRALSKF